MNSHIEQDGRGFETPKHLRIKALQVLEKVKTQDLEKLKNGAKYIRIDRKTLILKTNV